MAGLPNFLAERWRPGCRAVVAEHDVPALRWLIRSAAARQRRLRRV